MGAVVTALHRFAINRHVSLFGAADPGLFFRSLKQRVQPRDETRLKRLNLYGRQDSPNDVSRWYPIRQIKSLQQQMFFCDSPLRDSSRSFRPRKNAHQGNGEDTRQWMQSID